MQFQRLSVATATTSRIDRHVSRTQVEKLLISKLPGIPHITTNPTDHNYHYGQGRKGLAPTTQHCTASQTTL